ncbi:minor capsid protein [Microbacterium sp. STF-2]|uniref:minor capsid protein n=1 Tax=Microbacterium sp. STF-2 TaxID=3031132 RepID=UPI002AFFDF6E|nr:minor capsid protein [Microbacterium sp. STF-2]MEA1264159.1 minor capsid protein [Microbacterium sp. STF-2]
MKDSELKTRLCEILGSIPGFEWSTTAAYGADSIGVWFGRIGDVPDRAVGVRLYGGSDDDDLKARKAQIWVRGARGERDSADDIADAVFARFNNLSREGGVLGIRRESMSDHGADDNDRDQRSENYTITLDNEEALQ